MLRTLGVFGLVGILSTAGWAQKSNESKKEIAPPDVYVRVGIVRKELELLRFEMGRPANNQPAIDISDAAPREVYFQALTMFRKADRFCFEHTRERKNPPKRPQGELQPKHVFEMVSAALERIQRVKSQLAITKTVKPDSRDNEKVPSDVFRSCVQANRQLNLLLDQRFSPSDVFQQVTSGVNLGSVLLTQFPNATRIPDEPKYESGKVPRDVYLRLIGCYQRLHGITAASGLKSLELKVDEDRLDQIEPSDVYDIASLVVSELAYLYEQLPNPPQPRGIYYPGRKFPSHVYQRVGILEAQIVQLEALVKTKPNWLKETNGE